MSQVASIARLSKLPAMWSRLMNHRMDRIQFIEDRPGQVVRHTGDWSKINRVLGWTPLLSWKEGLQRTTAWFEQNRELWSRQLFMRQIPITTASGKTIYHSLD